MSRFLKVAAALWSLSVAGCGTVPPAFEEFWAVDPDNTQQKVYSVAAQVSCELQQAVMKLIAQDRRQAELTGVKKIDWLNDWGVLVTLTLNVIEKTDLTPGISFNRPLSTATSIIAGQRVTTPQSFTFGLGAEGATTATRVGIVHMFYTVKDLLNYKNSGTTCVPSQSTPGFIFFDGRIGLEEWLYAAVSPSFLNLSSFPASKDKGPLGQDAISQEFKFEILSSGNLNPSWKLVNISANTSPNLVSGSRDRYQDLIVTLGPLDSTLSGKTTLAPSAQGLHQAEQFGLFTSSAIQQQ